MEIRLPSKPEIEQKPDKGEDLRKFAVLPFHAIWDRRMNPFAFRVLAAIASYSNRAGVSYVSQGTLAKQLKTTQPRISNAVTKLKACGWLKEIGKPVQGLRGATVQIMYAPDMTVEDAVAIASAKTNEDLRPPDQKEQELAEMMADNEKEWTEQELRDNKERLAKMLLDAYKTPHDKPKLYEPVKGDTQAVKKIKEEIRSRMRQIRKQEYADKGVIPKKEYNQSTYSLYAKTDMSGDAEKDMPMSETVCEQREPMTYKAIVDFVNDQLFEGVKTESDMQGCAWIAEIGITEDMLASYVRSYPGDTAYALAKRVIAKGGAGC